MLGLASSGVHSNGFSLVRRIIEQEGWRLDERLPGEGGRSLGDLLLEPTRIYVRSLLPLVQEGRVKGLAHITGGGLLENIPRVLPDSCHAIVDAGRWQLPAIFALLQQGGRIAAEELARTFNCGVGMAVIVAPTRSAEVTRRFGRRRRNGVRDRPNRRRAARLHCSRAGGQLELARGLVRDATMRDPKRVAILISGPRQQHARAGRAGAQLRSRPGRIEQAASAGPRLGTKHGLATWAQDSKGVDEGGLRPHSLATRSRSMGSGPIALAGFMRILSPWFVRALGAGGSSTSTLPCFPNIAGSTPMRGRSRPATRSAAVRSTRHRRARRRRGARPGRSADRTRATRPTSLEQRVLAAEHRLYPQGPQRVRAEMTDPLTKIREAALELPETEERLSHGQPTFFVAGKQFAQFRNNHHGDGKTVVCVRVSSLDEQAMLLEADPGDLFEARLSAELDFDQPRRRRRRLGPCRRPDRGELGACGARGACSRLADDERNRIGTPRGGAGSRSAS